MRIFQERYFHNSNKDWKQRYFDTSNKDWQPPCYNYRIKLTYVMLIILRGPFVEYSDVEYVVWDANIININEIHTALYHICIPSRDPCSEGYWRSSEAFLRQVFVLDLLLGTIPILVWAYISMFTFSSLWWNNIPIIWIEKMKK